MVLGLFSEFLGGSNFKIFMCVVERRIGWVRGIFRDLRFWKGFLGIYKVSLRGMEI